MAVIQYLGNSENYFVTLANIIVELGVFDGSGMSSAALVEKQLNQWHSVGLVSEQYQSWAKEQCDKLMQFYNGKNDYSNILVRNQNNVDEYWICNRSKWTLEFSFI